MSTWFSAVVSEQFILEDGSGLEAIMKEPLLIWKVYTNLKSKD